MRQLRLEVDEEGMYLDDKYEQVDIRGIDGMRVSAIRRHLEYVERTQPTIIYLDIGTNDLSSTRCDPCALAEAMYDCARELGRCPGVRHVIIGEVMRRCDHCRPDFEEARLIVNAELRRLVTGSEVVHVYH